MAIKQTYSPDEEDLSTTAEAFRKGSAEAFHILYRKYHQKVYRFCLRMLGEEPLAKDAFQDTFIRVYENRKSFHGSNFAAWLFTIARHTCLNFIRARKDYDKLDEEVHGSVQYIRSDVGLQNSISKAISMLPLALREALVLREYEEYSYQEIADILSIDLSLAKVRVHRGRLLLRKMLEPVVKELNES